MQSTAPPISSLPPLRQLSSYTLDTIQQALAGLRSLYFPPPPPKFILHRRHTVAAQIHDPSAPDSGYASAEGEEDEEDEVEAEEVSRKLIGRGDIDALRPDPFEREYAVKWLTSLIARSDLWIPGAPEGEDHSDTLEEKSRVVDDAASLLSLFAGGTEPLEPALTRDFSFPQSRGGSPVRVQLNDGAPLTADHTSVGLQSWASSIILAERICWEPSSFQFDSLDRPGIRILELGAGTGLLSIVASRFLPCAEVIATDYHPDVLANLRSNVSTNASAQDKSPISVHCLDWSSPPADGPFSEGSFDMILAADVIYHPDHAQWIKSCVQRYLRRGRHGKSCSPVFWLIIPLRSTGRHEGVGDTVEQMFPTLDPIARSSAGSEEELVILNKEEIGRRSGVGRADEGSYVLFQIVWR